MHGELDILKIILESGLVVKGVLILLIICSVVSWAIVMMKKKLIKELQSNNDLFKDVYQNSASLSDVGEKVDQLPFSPFREMFKSGYNELKKMNDQFSDAEALKSHFQNFGFDSINRSLELGKHQPLVELEKSLSTLASIGSVAPFIGLFGTVWGIIGSFTGLAGGGATIDAVAPGIAEALVATAVGLAAAIPAVWFYNNLNSQNEIINAEMDNFSKEFLNVVERTLG